MLRNVTVGSRLGSTVSTVLIQLSLHTLNPAKITSKHQSLDSLLEKCPTIKQLKEIHAQIIQIGFTNEILTVGKLIACCATSNWGDLHYARLLFDGITEPNRFMWNSLIRGYSNCEDPAEAILLYSEMILRGSWPNEFTFPFVLKACASKLALTETLVIHVMVIKLGYEWQVYVLNALLHAYGVCGLIESAWKVFEDMPERSVVSWNSMIDAYSQAGWFDEVLFLFQEMRNSGLEPDKFTLVNLLSVCSQVKNIDLGRLVHQYIEMRGVRTDLILKNALLDMYAKCGDLATAQILFDMTPDKNVVSWTSMVSAYAKHGLIDLATGEFDLMPVKSIVSWNSMISCYAQHGLCREAVNVFNQMQTSKVNPDEATLVSVLAACSQIGDLITGKKIDIYICSKNINPTITLYNSLIDMYAKCGRIDIALDLFSQMQLRNVVSYNVMIGALAMHGRAHDALNFFSNMKDIGFDPDGITFIGVLSACSHSGLINEGRYYFNAMSSVYGVPHEIEHYACMVDLLGRGGYLDAAVKMIGCMKTRPDAVIWGALLGACRIHGNVKIGTQALKQILELERYNGGLFLLISNIYSEANMWEDVKRVWKLMKGRQIRKVKAVSLVEIDCSVHEFVVEDKTHEISSQIYSILDHLTNHMRSMGYLTDSSRTFLDVEE